jgi:hypothetical protein
MGRQVIRRNILLASDFVFLAICFLVGSKMALFFNLRSGVPVNSFRQKSGVVFLIILGVLMLAAAAAFVGPEISIHFYGTPVWADTISTA